MNNDLELTDINKIVDDFMYSYMSHIADTNHSATGNLGLNQRKIIKWDGRYFSISLQLEDYWKYLEYGTKPHFPPISAIREWIRIKPVLPRPYNGKLPTENQLAYMIANKISKVGTPATHLLANTINDFQLESKIYNALETAFAKQAERIASETLN